MNTLNKNVLVKVISGLALAALIVIGLQMFARADGSTGYAGDKPWSFGVRGAYANPREGDKKAWSGGAQLRYFLSKALAVEGSIDYRRQDIEGGHVSIYPVQASLLGYILPWKPVSVYVLGGTGWYYTRVSPFVGEANTQNRFGLHAGAGLEVFLNNYWSLDGNYRYIWLEKFSSKSKSLEDKQFNDSGSQITVALNYHF